MIVYTRAYCWGSGQVAFTTGALPEGTLPIAVTKEGEDPKAFVETVRGLCRHSYDGLTLLVPGLPEAERDSQAALNALERFSWHVEYALGRKPALRRLRGLGDLRELLTPKQLEEYGVRVRPTED